jgi:hypothetical protein
VAGNVVGFRNRLHLPEPTFSIAQRLAAQFGVSVESLVEMLLVKCVECELQSPQLPLDDALSGDPSWPASADAPPDPTDRAPARVIPLAPRCERVSEDPTFPGSPASPHAAAELRERSKAIRRHAQRVCERATRVRQSTASACSWGADDVQAAAL